MSFGHLVIFAAGAVAGVAATKTETFKKATRSAIKAGFLAQHAAQDAYGKAKSEVHSVVSRCKKAQSKDDTGTGAISKETPDTAEPAS